MKYTEIVKRIFLKSPNRFIAKVLINGNEETHPEFAEAVKLAEESGVKILYLGCAVKEEELSINRLQLKA